MINLKEEKKLWKKGYRIVIGIDEVGRGCLSGPVVAAAVTISHSLKLKTYNSNQSGNFRFQVSSFRFQVPRLLKDSKKLTPKKKLELYQILINHSQIAWGIGKVGPKVIDRINILEATKLAMQRAVKNLNSKLKTQKSKPYLIIDGNFRIKTKIFQKSIVKADEKVFSCAAASIIAKVMRDRIMRRCHKQYPEYGLDKHKGYPTKFHRAMLKKHGPCDIHRKTFKPIKKMLK